MSKVVDSTEKGKRVFKKPQENREEEKYFYNEKYFADIGFPETKVYEGEMTEDGAMRGGYYKHTDKLTEPFRKYVNIVQTEGYFKGNSSDEVDDSDESYLNSISSVEDGDKSKDNTFGIFDRINNYAKITSDVIGPYLQKRQIELEPDQNVSPELEKEKDVNPIPDSDKKPENGNKKYWVVKIPIVKDDEFTPKGKYENAEIKMNQILREEKVDKKLGKSKIGNMYDVGSKYVRICEGVKEWERYEIDDIKLPGSKMEKILIATRSSSSPKN